MNSKVLRKLAEIEDELEVEIVFSTLVSGEAFGYQTLGEIPEVFFTFRYGLSTYLSVTDPEIVPGRLLDPEEGEGIAYVGIELREFLRSLYRSDFRSVKSLRSSRLICDDWEYRDQMLEFSAGFLNRQNFINSGIRLLRGSGEIQDLYTPVSLKDYLHNLHTRLMMWRVVDSSELPEGDLTLLLENFCKSHLSIPYLPRLGEMLKCLSSRGDWPYVPDQIDVDLHAVLEVESQHIFEKVLNEEEAEDEINNLFKDIIE